jgi:hypothetical protein
MALDHAEILKALENPYKPAPPPAIKHPQGHWREVVDFSPRPEEMSRRNEEYRRVSEVLGSLEIQDPMRTAFQPEVLVVHVSHDMVEIRLNIWAAHRDQHTMGWIGSSRVFPHGVPTEGLLSLVHMNLKTLILHELDESLLVNGVRRWDPHL